MIYQLRIQLLEIEPPIVRQVEVPGSMTLAKLHNVIQIAMGWKNYHLYLFEAGRQRFGEGISEWGEYDQNIRNARRTTLEQVAPRKGARLLYTYDMGDGWDHEVQVQAILGGTVEKIRCVAGQRSCPPEDCGGPHGYETLLTVLFNPRHPEYQELKDWAGEFSPEEFSLDVVNRRLARLKVATRAA